jgi:poly-gamma-glutamate capsule biosynthesis protein CapA/YwtB (metallophosphatase superfamily)
MFRVASLLLSVSVVACVRPAPDGGAAQMTTLHAGEPSVALGIGAPGASPMSTTIGPPPPAPPTEPLRVLVGGDLIPHRPSLAAPSALLAALAPMAPLFGRADVVVANYEAATGELEKKAFRLAYAASPAWLESLPAAGIKAVSVANNHACDLDYDGVEATLATAAKAGLTTLGGDAKGDPWAPRTLVERGGKRVCAIAWTTFLNAEGGCARTTRLAVASENAAGRQKVAAALLRARATCDATIAIVHGGVEYVPQTPSVMTVARQAADAGADAVVVHHPHIASPVVVHKTKDGRKIPIFASVGNLVSNQGESWKPPMFPVLRENRRLVCVNGWTRLGVLADLSFDFSGADAVGPKLDWTFHLLWTENEHAQDRSPVPKITTRLLDPQTDATIIARLTDDEVGPVDLFDDPCWVERPLYAAGDHERDPRCGTTLVRSTPSTSASSSRAKKKRP